MAEQSDTATQRIVVVLGTGPSGKRVLDVLMPLLEREAAVDLQGVIVEEADLQRAAELPFVKELSRLTSGVREFQKSDARRQVALRVRAAQKSVAMYAGKAGISYSFRNVQGSTIRYLKEAASESDITVFEPAHSGSITQGTAPGRRSRHRFVVAIEDADTATDTLRVASILARGQGQRLLVLHTGSDEHLRRLAQRLFAEASPAIRELSDTTPASIINAVRAEGASALVIAATGKMLESDRLRRFREELRCPVILVRRPH